VSGTCGFTYIPAALCDIIFAMSRETHYDCQIVHLNRKGEESSLRHKPTCQVAEGHAGSTMKCPACAKEYQATYWTTPGRRDQIRSRKGVKRNSLHFHYACTLPVEDHPILRGVGRDHRAGCAIAEDHVGPTSSNNCPACRKVNQRRTSRATGLRHRHQMTVVEYDHLFEKQQGRCAICERAQEGLRLAVDHSHQTGERRGLLCRACNLGLGNFRDDPASLQRAIEYLVRG